MPILNDEGFIELSQDKVKLKPYKPRPFKTVEYMTDQEILSGAGGILIGDTETFKNYFLISFKDVKTKKYIVFEPPFNERKLSWLMHNYTTVGFNWLKYDLPIIWYSYVTQDVRDLQQLSNAIIFENLYYQQAQSQFQFKIFPTNTIDLIEVAPLKGSLKLYGARLHAPRIQELPFDIEKELTEEEKLIIKHYNFNDLDTTELLFHFMKERLELRKDMSLRYHENLMSKSDAQIAEVVISKEVGKALGKYPPKSDIKAGYSFKYEKPSYIRYATDELKKLLNAVLKSDFVVNEFGTIDTPRLLKDRSVTINGLEFSFGIGGLHSCEKCITYKADEDYIIVDRDVTSYYPDILLTLGLYPEQLGPSFLSIYKGFKDERVEAKKTKQFTYDKGLKILINGTSGKLNSQHSRLYSPKSYIHMTITGQLSILMLVEILTCNGFKIISGNTDGIVIYCKRNEYEKLLYWIDFWEKETKFKTEETQYKEYHARDVNSYFALKLDGSVKVKGSYAEVGSQSGTQLDKNCQYLICADAIKLLLGKGIPIEKTIKECKDITRFVEIRNVTGGAHKDGEYLGKVVRWYFAKNVVGTINKVSNNYKVPDTEGAKPCMDLPEAFPDDINYAWYINKTLEMLQDCGYMKKPKQVSFF